MKSKKTATLFLRAGILPLVILYPLLILAGCSTTPTLSTRASQVRLISALQAHAVESECRFLGNVAGTYSYGSCCLVGFNLFGSYWNYNEHALNELLDNAAELGATHVFVNIGNGLELKGEAFLCAYCADTVGNPDEDYCLSSDDSPETDFCADNDGNPIGTAYCQGAEGDNPVKCRANRGKWSPAILQTQCEARGYTWVNKSGDRRTCESRGGAWRPRAKDQISCENKGGTWLINEDILRSTLSPAKTGERDVDEQPVRKRLRTDQ